MKTIFKKIVLFVLARWIVKNHPEAVTEHVHDWQFDYSGNDAAFFRCAGCGKKAIRVHGNSQYQIIDEKP